MAEEVTTEEGATPTEEPQEQPLGPAGEKALAAMKQQLKEARAAARTGEEAQRKLAEFEERSKTEQERVLDQVRREASEAATAPLQLQVDRLEIAIEKGLSLTQAKRLVGSNRDELASDADALLEEFGSPKQSTPSFNGGPRQTGTAASFNDMIRRAAGRT
jgi:hypothetical protein